jgi:endonuclease YncB( thermonuclease family)
VRPRTPSHRPVKSTGHGPHAAPEQPMKEADFQVRRYRAIVLSHHDGDTLRVTPIDPVAIRLDGIDAAEVQTNVHGKADPVKAAADLAKLVAIVPVGSMVNVEEKVDRNGQVVRSFERVIGNVYVKRDGPELASVVDLLRAAQ